MNKNIDINTLVSKLLTGEISEEEGKELLSRVEQDASLKDKIEHLMNEDDFLQRYHLYKSIDAEKAKATFKASLQHAEEQEDRNDDKDATIIFVIISIFLFLCMLERNRKIEMMTKMLPSSGCDA